ncbi:ABC transporter substrate-binding protein [Actinophytocola sp.]|uniref:ABC transporter substrate-binding protein n=1 Tax=Actinophytocola sp. TaxID=1872138 RepID=UPI003D6C24C5
MKPRVLALGAVMALTLAACGQPGGGGGGSQAEEGTIKVAVMDAQSGQLSTFGIETIRGAQMAFDEINERGGVTVGGQQYRFDVEEVDLQSDPAIAAQAAQEAITGDGAQIIVGATPSALSEPIAGVVLRSGGRALHLAAATSLDKYAGKGDPIFRTLTPDDLTAQQYISVLKNEFPDVSTVSALMINDAVGTSIMDIYPPEFEKSGMQVVSKDTFPTEETNFAPLIQRTPNNVDAFFIGYSDPVSVALVNAAIEANRGKVFFNRGSVCQVGIDAGTKIDAYTCVIYTEDPLNPSTDKAKDFFARYEKKFDRKVDSNSAQALYYYDYIFLLAQAIEKAGTTEDMNKVADALRGSSYEGVVDVGFDEDGVNKSPIKVGIVRDGQMSVIATEE